MAQVYGASISYLLNGGRNIDLLLKSVLGGHVLASRVEIDYFMMSSAYLKAIYFMALCASGLFKESLSLRFPFGMDFHLEQHLYLFS